MTHDTHSCGAPGDPTHQCAQHSSALRWGIVFVVACLALVGDPALAHRAESLRGGLAAGAMHPLRGPDHLLAMVSVGIWGALLGRPLLIVLPVVFPLMMAVAGVAAILGLPLAHVELGVAVSVIALGAVIALDLSPPTWVAVALVAMFAVFHGHAHGQELPSLADPVGYSIGFVTVTGALHLTGIALGSIDRLRGGRTVLRAVGAAIAACGGWFLLQALA